MKQLYDKNNCLVNITSSILKHYDVTPFHSSNEKLDGILSKTNKKICLLLLDGFGSKIREVYKDYCPFIREHFFTKITSVFPATTVAATTALTTDRFPLETGWLGWTTQFPKYKDAVLTFMSSLETQKTPINPSVKEELPYKTIFEILNEHNVKADTIQNFTLEDSSLNGFFKATNDKLKEVDFLYAYNTEPDHTLHDEGVGSEKLIPIIKALDEGVKKLVEENKDTLFIVLADHGHLNCKNMEIDEHEDFFSLLKYKHFACEGRAAFFFVEEENKEKFKELATKYYGDYFYILTKEEVIKNDIFGVGNPSPKFESLLGDFLLISKDESCFAQTYFREGLASTHAGSSDDEIYIDVSLFNQD